MDPNQQQLLLTGGAKDKVYIDDVFSTYLYKGNQTAGHTITNGIDLAGEGGMVWIKSRTTESVNEVVDSARGVGHLLATNNNSAQGGSTSAEVDQFNSNGFRLAYRSAGGNVNNIPYASWTFRKAPGFFDIVTYDGNNASSRDVPHNLGCVPGMIILKRTDSTGYWWTYHKDLGRASTDWSKVMMLDEVDDSQDATCLGSDTHQNASTFRIGNDNACNTTGASYVAYLFGGGESKADTARSVDFNGSGAYLSVPDTNGGWDLGTSDFTIETWLRFDGTSTTSTNDTIFDGRHASANTPSYYWYVNTSGKIAFGHNNGNFNDTGVLASKTVLSPGVWCHAAVSKSGNTIKLFLNGTEEDSASDTRNYTMGFPNIGWRGTDATGSSLTYWNGLFSNFRIVKGTAVYTSSFRPPTEPLTNITNTSLLLCNNSSVTGSTVTTGTITATGSPTASTDSPFDDPECYKFGENEDSQVVKCGSYIGNTTTAPVIELGWEPQYIMVKSAGSDHNWAVFNNVSGINWSQDEKYLYPNLVNVEYTAERMKLFPTGFYVDTSAGVLINGNGVKFVYMAIRRSDALAGKPAEVGTDVFGMAYGTNTTAASLLPSFASTFEVDMRLQKEYNGNASWYIGTRMRDHRQLHTNTNAAEVTGTYTSFEHSRGEGNNWNSSRIGYMWKRHAGFDVVSYLGDGSSSRAIPHNLNQIPQMIWIKNTTHSSTVWVAGHIGLNGGSNPWDYWIRISGGTEKEASDGGIAWGGKPPTKTHFHVGGWTEVNQSQTAGGCVAYLFASVDNVSKLGFYDGDDSTDGSKVIPTGFQPRFIMIKCVTNDGENWNIVDSLRGLSGVGGGNDKLLKLNSANSQGNADAVDVSATGFALRSGSGDWNAINQKYIYYAHA